MPGCTDRDRTSSDPADRRSNLSDKAGSARALTSPCGTHQPDRGHQRRPRIQTQKSHPCGWLSRHERLDSPRARVAPHPRLSNRKGDDRPTGSRFYLASCCFRRGLPPNYHRRCCVSQPSSRWIGVGPQRYGHQDSLDPQVSPENCIGYPRFSLSREYVGSGSKAWSASCGQALGLLVLLRFTHYCAST